MSGSIFKIPHTLLRESPINGAYQCKNVRLMAFVKRMGCVQSLLFKDGGEGERLEAEAFVCDPCTVSRLSNFVPKLLLCHGYGRSKKYSQTVTCSSWTTKGYFRHRCDIYFSKAIAMQFQCHCYHETKIKTCSRNYVACMWIAFSINAYPAVSKGDLTGRDTEAWIKNAPTPNNDLPQFCFTPSLHCAKLHSINIGRTAFTFLCLFPKSIELSIVNGMWQIKMSG